MDNWIKIKDAQPEDGDIVYTYFESAGVGVAIYRDLWGTAFISLGPITKKSGRNLFTNNAGSLTDVVTHWMPVQLPKPPEGGN